MCGDVCVWVGVQGDLLWGVCCVKCVYFDIKIGGKDVGRITATTQGCWSTHDSRCVGVWGCVCIWVGVQGWVGGICVV